MDRKLLSSRPQGLTVDLDPLPGQSEASSAPRGLVAWIASASTSPTKATPSQSGASLRLYSDFDSLGLGPQGAEAVVLWPHRCRLDLQCFVI